LSAFFDIDIISIVGSGGNKRHKLSAQRGSISFEQQKKVTIKFCEYEIPVHHVQF
jgi:hypothetical protein